MMGWPCVVLLVEDDPYVLRALSGNLRADGFVVSEASCGREALDHVERAVPDLMVTERVLPDMGGFELCMKVKRCADIPIIMLSGDYDENTVVRALESYVEDYVVKPVGYRQVRARISRVLRRTRQASALEHFVRVDDHLRIDVAGRRAFVGSEHVRLTPIENGLLAILARNTHRVVSHRELVSEVWPHKSPSDRCLWATISRLRRKLGESTGRAQRLVTKRGIGYQLKASPISTVLA